MDPIPPYSDKFYELSKDVNGSIQAQLLNEVELIMQGQVIAFLSY